MDVSMMTHQELYKLEDQIAARRKALYELEPKFLPDDVREKIKSYVIEFDYECNGDQFYADDYSLHSDKELIIELESHLNGDEDDALYQTAKGYQAEWEMLGGK